MDQKKMAIVSVINDLVTDQRVDKSCRLLTQCGFDVLLVGRTLPQSPPLPKRDYKMHRFRLPVHKGPLFYALFNLRLFFFLLGQKPSLLLANDLDTLLPNYLAGRLKKIPLVYDSHEFFTEVPELIRRPWVRKVWLTIEKKIFPRLKHAITVSPHIADSYSQKYGVPVEVVRNVPMKNRFRLTKTRKELNLPEDRKILILQGNGINVQRGAEELVEAMQWVKDATLLIIGGGDVFSQLQLMSRDLNLTNRIIFVPRVSPETLYQYTALCDIGLTLEKDTNLNYRYSLPNKLFEYIHAGIPVIASGLPEVRRIVEQFDIGTFIPDHDPKSIAGVINEVIADESRLSHWKANTAKAARQLYWEKESEPLKRIFESYA
ncbi:MAG: glycosyltransferase [Bacteroidales bacterium]